MSIYFEDLVVTDEGILKIKDNCENGLELRFLNPDEIKKLDRALERLRAIAELKRIEPCFLVPNL